ncbi:hypothetical protein DI487_09695 [Flavobacterium sediminis]|uniref:Uncharacterized protein n=1 Tax=Flavobacterium sediminis TaxID=2201181 RepID=A0A2U8QVA7_9FLAO|nr:hypothetical protein DI487_09695 [Flavobacterium sediminis]
MEQRGKQGQVVIKNLLQKNHTVRTLVRNPDKFNKLIKHEKCNS